MRMRRRLNRSGEKKGGRSIPVVEKVVVDKVRDVGAIVERCIDARRRGGADRIGYHMKCLHVARLRGKGTAMLPVAATVVNVACELLRLRKSHLLGSPQSVIVVAHFTVVEMTVDGWKWCRQVSNRRSKT